MRQKLSDREFKEAAKDAGVSSSENGVIERVREITHKFMIYILIKARIQSRAITIQLKTVEDVVEGMQISWEKSDTTYFKPTAFKSELKRLEKGLRISQDAADLINLTTSKFVKEVFMLAQEVTVEEKKKRVTVDIVNNIVFKDGFIDYEPKRS